MAAPVSTPRGGRGVARAATGPLIVGYLAGCTSLLGVDGEYRGEDGGATVTSTGTTGASTMAASTATGAGGSSVTTATGTGGAPATTSTGGEGGGDGEGAGGAGSGGFDGLPACPGRPIVDVFDDEDGYRLIELGGTPAAPRVRLGADGLVVTSRVGGSPLAYYGAGDYFAFDDMSDAAPLADETYLTAALDASGAIALLGPTAPVTVSPTTGLTALLDAKPVSPQAMRFLVVREGVIEDYGWDTATAFDLYGDAVRTFDCDPELVAYVEDGEDAAAVVCSGDEGMILTGARARTRVGPARAIAALREEGRDLVVVVGDDGVFLHPAQREDGGAVTWLAPLQLDVAPGTAEVFRPAIASAPGDDAVVAWTRHSGGGLELAAARCTAEGCCDLALEDVVEGVPALAGAIERWGPALAREPGGALALAFATFPSAALAGALDGLRIVGFTPDAQE